MNEPPRLLDQDDDALKRMILRSSELDVPSARSMRRAHALAFGIASSTVAGVGAAASGGGVAAGAMLGTVSTVKTIAIWVGVGLLSGTLVSGTAATLIDLGAHPEARDPQAKTAEIERSAATNRSDPRAGAAPRPETNGIPTANAPSVAAYPAEPATRNQPLPGKRPASPSTDSVSPNPVAIAVPQQSAARYDAVTPEPQSAKAADELAQELALVDKARSALRSGNAASALDLVSRYERSYKRPRFRPEASALRIEALIALGRRAEAAQLARMFMANHPGHPLTVRLRGFLGEAP